MQVFIEHLSHSYGQRRVLEDISFAIEKGEFLCLAGESGCGKSTLLRLIAGLERPDQGIIRRDQQELSSASTFIPAQERRMGLVFQHPSLFPHLSVLENVLFGMVPASHERAKTLLTQVRFSGREHDRPYALSGGQQQRVALARALAADPELLLMDEPFASLDYDLRKDVRRDIHQLLTLRGIPTLMVTHDPQEALQLADRIVLLSQTGRIEQIGTPRELYLQPASDYAARFFGHANIVEQEGARLMIRPEHIHLKAGGPMQASVKHLIFSGSHQQVTLDWNGQTLLVKDYALTSLQVGEHVAFEFEMTHAHALLAPSLLQQKVA